MKTQDGLLYNPLVAWFLSMIAGMTPMGCTAYLNGPNGLTDATWPMLLGFIIIPIWVTNVHAYWEAVRIEIKNQKINHGIRVVIRVGIATVISVFIHWFSEQGFDLQTFYRSLAAVAVMMATFWIVFDSALNVHRGKPFFYIGRTSRIDNLFKSVVSIWIISKVVFMTISILIYLTLIR